MLMDSSHWFNTIDLGRAIVHFQGYQVIIKKYCIICLMIFIALTNSVDPDEMSHYALCGISSGSSLFVELLLYEFRGFPNTKG